MTGCEFMVQVFIAGMTRETNMLSLSCYETIDAAMAAIEEEYSDSCKYNIRLTNRGEEIPIDCWIEEEK